MKNQINEITEKDVWELKTQLYHKGTNPFGNTDLFKSNSNYELINDIDELIQMRLKQMVPQMIREELTNNPVEMTANVVVDKADIKKQLENALKR